MWPPKLVRHGWEQLVVERVPADAGIHRPAAVARIGYVVGEPREPRVLDQDANGQVEQPRGDHAAAPLHVGDVGQVERGERNEARPCCRFGEQLPPTGRTRRNAKWWAYHAAYGEAPLRDELAELVAAGPAHQPAR
jgi:hypothetical protein